MSDPAQKPPIQPVAQPILNAPYDEPTRHWVYDTNTGQPSVQTGRRDAFYWYKTERTGSAQGSLFAEESRDDLPLVNKLRNDVRRWRASGYRNATPVTRQLLAHWSGESLPRRLFFCQREAVETIIYLHEILASGRKISFKPELSPDDYAALTAGQPPSFAEALTGTLVPSLCDQPADPSLPGLLRYGCKMATGSGKTVVMSMLIAWAFCNRSRSPSDERFPAVALVVCPNLTVRDRLQVLRPERDDNYYDAFHLVPLGLRDALNSGQVLVTNWHAFLPESPHKEGDATYTVVDKGEESPEAFARKRLGDLADSGPIMVFNDEAHHAYRPKSMESADKGEDKTDWEEATRWVGGLDTLNASIGIALTVDLSATPFYLQSSGHAQGTPFPWLVSDFGLVDAIESGITKIPRLPVSDTTGRPEPKYFALWDSVMSALQPGEKLPGGKPKPEAAWREAEDAVQTLAAQWKERFDYFAAASTEQEQIPPVLIVVVDNTDLAQLFYEKISGETTDDAGNTAFGKSAVREEFANRPGQQRTVRIDSKLLAKAESLDGMGGSKAEAAEALRHLIATVGERGQPGEQVRCVVSVQMLSEGWDANNVTHILGLRAFRSQLLSEQVVGRGLRRIDYTPDPETGQLTEEYVDVYGIPFSVIPYKGRESGGSAPEDKPKQHVTALEERGAFEMRFPIVEGYSFALRQNLVSADVDAMQELVLDPFQTPTAVFVNPQVGYQEGKPSQGGNFEQHDRQAYYAEHHIQTIQFEIARQVVARLTEHSESGGGDKAPKLRGHARHQLFPQVYHLVDQFVQRKVQTNGQDVRELGLERYTRACLRFGVRLPSVAFPLRPCRRAATNSPTNSLPSSSRSYPNPRADRSAPTTEPRSTVSSGSSAPVPRGATCPNATASGKRSTSASVATATQACSTTSCERCT